MEYKGVADHVCMACSGCRGHYAAIPGPVTIRCMITLSRQVDMRLLVGLLLLFASLSLALGIYQARQVLHLLQHGLRASAEVVAVHSGARGARKAVLRFRTASGEVREVRDRFLMHLVRYHAGDAVIALYDPLDPDNATVDNGPWIWQEPGFLLAGFVVLAGLAILIPRAQARQA